MKFTLLQWLWVLAVVALTTALVADIAGLADVPDAYWLGFAALAVIGHWLLPSMRELNQAHRRQR